jgi:acyl carrier protein
MGPRNVAEVRTEVGRVWAELLGIEEVPLDAHFYDIGGSSLQFVVLLARVKEATGRAVEPARFFRCPTVRIQADLLAES